MDKKRLVTKNGIILKKDYTPEADSTGIGPTIGGSGGLAVTFNHEDEKWVLLVKIEGDVEPIEVEKQDWIKVKEKQKIEVIYKKGYFFPENLYFYGYNL